MKMMQPPLRLVILVLSTICKAEVRLTDQNGQKNESISSEVNKTTNVWALKLTNDGNASSSVTVASYVTKQDFNATTSSNMTTTLMAQYSSTKKALFLSSQYIKKSLPTSKPPTTTPNNTTNACKDDRFKTGIMICAIIIAVLVLVCAVLIICSIALATKVSRLKTKLTQSKRQARSNGDFLSASSILWPSGMETWQKKALSANQTMDEISLGNTNNIEENHKLMEEPVGDKPKDNQEDKDKNTTSKNETMTVISTVEV
ncbi:protein EVI2A [Hyperolius riggenbachi]|uniref:protein EVI2A n=1 Tax=Hyperolius riggenbachi TaxID=752182 RepID=UPI0035A267EE